MEGGREGGMEGGREGGREGEEGESISLQHCCKLLKSSLGFE